MKMPVLVPPDSSMPVSPETKFREEILGITEVLKTLKPSEARGWLEGLQEETVEALRALQEEIGEWGI